MITYHNSKLSRNERDNDDAENMFDKARGDAHQDFGDIDRDGLSKRGGRGGRGRGRGGKGRKRNKKKKGGRGGRKNLMKFVPRNITDFTEKLVQKE